MLEFLAHIFTIVIYQPFFNILVFFYWLTGWVMSPPNMGVAVIGLTLIIRMLLLPLSLAADRSEKERRDIMAKLDALKQKFSADPVIYEREKKKVMRSNKRVMMSEFVNLIIQIIIAVMLIRIFNKGLEGQDTHLIYSFMPKVEMPFNLMFLGDINLGEPSLILNLIQSFLIFVFEALVMLYSAYAVSRKDVIRLQFVLPLLTFFAFLFFPAGKKVFVITSLVFSIGLIFSKQIIRMWQKFVLKKSQEEAEDKEAVVVMTK